jgi:hypothetical protein
MWNGNERTGSSFRRDGKSVMQELGRGASQEEPLNPVPLSSLEREGGQMSPSSTATTGNAPWSKLSLIIQILCTTTYNFTFLFYV